ncbi:MAG: hypothetical protein U9Q81_21985, partial [Pseudomonadota bacterium]|nr:hypothetical protein [Pseudomonadota bacterium]
PVGGAVFECDLQRESEFVQELADRIGMERYDTGNVCVDITGFMRPHLLFLLLFFQVSGFKKVDFLYAEPGQYRRQEDTTFSDEDVTEVRQVEGFEGQHSADTSKDLLVLGTGYDHALISQVAKNKDHARKAQILGLPSLMPDMYQENVLRVQRAAEAVGVHVREARASRFAPANDPFVTAAVLRDIIEEERSIAGLSNLYLSPLGTKAQALGFGLYFVNECRGEATSLLFPFHRNYSAETSIRCGTVWLYRVEFL